MDCDQRGTAGVMCQVPAAEVEHAWWDGSGTGQGTGQAAGREAAPAGLEGPERSRDEEVPEVWRADGALESDQLAVWKVPGELPEVMEKQC